MADKKTKKKTQKADPGLYNGAELAAALGTVGARVGELEAAIANNKRDAHEKITQLEGEIKDASARMPDGAYVNANAVLTGLANTEKRLAELEELVGPAHVKTMKAIAELASTVATAASSTGTPIGDGAMLRELIREAIEADRKANPLRR